MVRDGVSRSEIFWYMVSQSSYTVCMHMCVGGHV